MFFGTIWLFFVCFYTTYWCIYYYNDYMSINGDVRQWYWNKMTVTYCTIFWFHNIHINFARSQALLHVCKIFSFKLPGVFFMVVWCYDQSPKGLELTFGITVVHQSSPHIYFFNTCIFTRNTKGFIKSISKSIHKF